MVTDSLSSRYSKAPLHIQTITNIVFKYGFSQYCEHSERKSWKWEQWQSFPPPPWNLPHLDDKRVNKTNKRIWDSLRLWWWPLLQAFFAFLPVSRKHRWLWFHYSSWSGMTVFPEVGHMNVELLKQGCIFLPRSQHLSQAMTVTSSCVMSVVVAMRPWTITWELCIRGNSLAKNSFQAVAIPLLRGIFFQGLNNSWTADRFFSLSH